MKENEKYAIYSSCFGDIKICYNDAAITYIKKINIDEYIDLGVQSELSNYAFSQIKEFCNGERKSFDFVYELTGTEFQKKVWAALCDIPYGETRSYKEIAVAINNPKAARAVGMANNKNPITIVVPCHRVIGANGRLVGYAGGLDMKKDLLEIEKKNSK